jgi:hypothetical protein
MTFIPTDFPRPQESDNKARQALAMRWAALHDAADAVALLAGIAPERPAAAIRAFPAQIREAGGWRLALAETGVDDLAAIMRPGLAALLAVKARGQDALAPARALWHEFDRSRAALLALVPEAGELGPRRSA